MRGHRFVGRGLDPRPCGFLVEPVLLRAERRQLCDLGVPPQLLLVHRSAVLLLHLPVRVKVEDAARALRREHPIRRLLRRLDGVDEISVLGVLDAVGREGVGDAARPLRHRPVLVPQIVPGLVHRGSSTEERPRARCHLCRATRRAADLVVQVETGSKKSESLTELVPMEIPTLGENCAFRGCGQLDFLPFVCRGCAQTFCLDHRNDHGCGYVGSSVRCYPDGRPLNLRSYFVYSLPL